MAPSELGQALVHGLSKITMLQIFWEIQRNLVCLVLLVGIRMHKIVLFTSPSRVVSVGPGSSFQALTGSWPTAQAIFSLGLGQVGQVTWKEPGKKDKTYHFHRHPIWTG